MGSRCHGVPWHHGATDKRELGAVREGAVAQLAVIVGAPAEQRPLTKATGMRAPGAHRSPARRTLDCHGDGLVRLAAGAELAAIVRAPAPQSARTETTRMR